MDLDVVIFGGGAAGLWLLDELSRGGHSAVLFEANALGAGQTVASQGILHGGLKYTLSGLLTKSATGIRDMPANWRDCLEGRREPNLRAVRRRSESCYLWRTDSIASRVGMIGARFGLRIAPQSVAHDERPDLLRGCPGTVAQLPEQVISPVSLIEELASRNSQRIGKIDPDRIRFDVAQPGEVRAIHLGDQTFRPRCVVFTAGAGNAALRQSVGISTDAMQRRPLHMVLLRGSLPQFQGHCVDGAKTRVTITSDMDSARRTVWQVGGQIAEDGVGLDSFSLLNHARAELSAVLPGIDFSSVDWSTYRVDRAEGRVLNGQRPESVQIRRDGNCFTAWPTKLVLVPQLVAELSERISPPLAPLLEAGEKTRGLSSPTVALPPWETAANWVWDADIDDQRARAKAA